MRIANEGRAAAGGQDDGPHGGLHIIAGDLGNPQLDLDQARLAPLRAPGSGALGRSEGRRGFV